MKCPRHSWRYELLLLICIQAPFISTVRAHDSRGRHFVCVVIEPLQKLHIELKLPVCKLLNLNFFIDLKLLENVIEYLQVSGVVIFVLCIEV